ncbi:hypothetical protein F4781DRAFT_417575 [Annulohypoxylon bovei var. microspora]|nr:hypothetical protein F4781DRAFT_417575 [Annulohypoxylon bovei var. microspora]
MGRISMSLRKMYEDAHEKTSGKHFHHFHRRSYSVPSLKILNQVHEEEHVLGESPQRSISRNSKIKHPKPLHHTIPQYLATVRNSRLALRSEDEDYDSDEEDRRNGVPIIVTENRGCKFSSAMVTSVSRKIEEKQEEKCRLQKLLVEPKSKYLEARAWYFENRGMDWNVRMWSHFIELEDEFFKITDQIYNLECEITNLETRLSSFVDCKRLSPTGHWDIEEDGTRTFRI